MLLPSFHVTCGKLGAGRYGEGQRQRTQAASAARLSSPGSLHTDTSLRSQTPSVRLSSTQPLPPRTPGPGRLPAFLGAHLFGSPLGNNQHRMASGKCSLILVNICCLKLQPPGHNLVPEQTFPDSSRQEGGALLVRSFLGLK